MKKKSLYSQTEWVLKMKWRERISILSRKRKQSRHVITEENQDDSTSPSGSTDAVERENVEKTLSQIRPVIGPDHKSYYILLRGNEDSFTCIQPAKDVITSLDEVVKNVVNSVKQTRSQGPAIPPYLKTSRNGGTRSYRNASKKFVNENRKLNGLSQNISDEVRIDIGRDLDNLCVSQMDEKFLGTENVVENVVLNRTVQTVNSNHNEVTRTSTLVYPLVQNRLDFNGAVLGTNKQESCSFIPSKKSLGKTSTPVTGGSSSLKGFDHSVLQPNTIFIKQEPEVQISKDLSSVNVTKEGSMKSLLQPDSLIIGEDSRIVAVRGNAQEVILRISPKEADVSQLLEHHQIKQEILELSNDLLRQDVDEEEADVLTLPDSTLQEEICYNPEMLADSSSNSDDPENSRIQYLLTSISPSPHEMFEDSQNSDIEKVMQEEGYCMIDPSIQDPDPLEMEKLLQGDALQNEEIVVFQREDGALVNQDGTPVSSELQYLIATTQTQPDDQTHLDDGYAHHILLSTKP